jgi:hypothetical protein
MLATIKQSAKYMCIFLYEIRILNGHEICGFAGDTWEVKLADLFENF